METFHCPLTEADYATMADISRMCSEQLAPFIAALDDLGIDTKGLSEQNAAQQHFCDTACRLHAEGRL